MISRASCSRFSQSTRRYLLLGSCLGLGAAGLSAADLVVQGSNSPYVFSVGTASYDNIYVGRTSNGILNQIAGTLNVTSGQLFLGYAGGITGTYLLSGGTLNTVSTDVGDYGTGVFTLSAAGVHNVTSTSGTAAGSLDLGVYAGSNGTYNLNGGTLTAGYVRGGAGTSTFNFNGGTLTAGADATDFFQNLTHAYVRNGGALINSGAYSVTIAQNLVTGPSGNGTDGGLTKTGAGTLTLTGNNTYAGVTTINAGTLQVGNGGTTGSLGTNTGPISNNGTLVFNRKDDITVSNIILGGGALTKLGAGTLTLTSNNIYSGNVTVSEGTLNLTGKVQGGSSATLTVDRTGGGTAALGLSTATSSLSTGVTYVGSKGTGTVNQTGGTFTTNGQSFTLGNATGSNGTYNLSGTGSVSTGVTYVGESGTGTFNQTGGTLTANGGGPLGG